MASSHSDPQPAHGAPEPSRARGRPIAGPPPGGDLAWVGLDTVAVRVSLTIDQVATARNVAGMRRAFATWLALDVAAGDLVDDVVLVVYEALANVTDHAYLDTPDGAGTVRLTAHRAHDLLRITVADDGRWRTGAGTGACFRGRGLSVMRRLIGQVHIETTAAGTVVHLRCALPPPATLCGEQQLHDRDRPDDDDDPAQHRLR